MEADYVVVGAGSAGCVMADRLSEAGHSVIVLEAGRPDGNPYIHVPAGLAKLVWNPAVNWGYAATPQAGTAGRAIGWPRGKVLGGSSSINGMLYVRGNRADFDGWAQRGCRGWAYDEVLPYFRKSETYATAATTSPRPRRAADRRGLPHDPAADAPIRRGRAAGGLRFNAD